MKGIELLLMDHFIENGRRQKRTIKDIAGITRTSQQNSRNLLQKSIEKGYLATDERVHPAYYRMTDLGLKVWKGLRNVQDKIVVIK